MPSQVSATFADFIQDIRQEAYLFYLIQYDKSFKFSQRSESFATFWDKTYQDAIPSGVGCDFILGTFSVVRLLLQDSTMREADQGLVNGLFTLCGQVIVALERRGFFVEAFTKAEIANLKLAAQSITETARQEMEARQERGSSAPASGLPLQWGNYGQ